MMNVIKLILIFCVLSLPLPTVIAQNLEDSRISSYYTFIYKIDNQHASELYKDLWNLENEFLSDLYDLYQTDSVYNKKLPVGHYVFIHAEENNLHIELKSVNNVQLNLLKNHRDLMLVLADSNGCEVRNAEVVIKQRTVPFDRVTQSYRLAKANPRGLLAVRYNGHTSFFDISRQRKTGYFIRNGREVIKSWPVRIITSPFTYIVGNVRSLVNGGNLYAPRLPHVRRADRQFSGFVAFNKPVYRPGDSIKIKAFITDRKGKPYGKKTVIHLEQSWPDYTNQVLDTLRPYRPGGFLYEFVPSDSIKLTLDKSHTIHFKDKKKRTLISRSFRYEAYELNNNFFAVRSESHVPQATALYLKGHDSNNMPLYDIRYEVIIKPVKVKQFYKRSVFVADTLWFYKGKLDPLGETKVSIPDSVFPDASLIYTAEIIFYNSENERIVKRQELNFDRKEVPISMMLQNDSLVIHPHRSDIKNVWLEVHKKHSISQLLIDLPYREKLNEYVSLYRITHDKNGKSLSMDGVSDELEILASQTQDSVFIRSQNPRKLAFRYFIFRNQHVIARGYGETLNFKQASGLQAIYSVSVQYIWAGEGRFKEFNIPFNKQNLDIKLDHDAMIYPGQNATFTITVKDASGEPVQDVDLTAFAITKKFRSPNIPAVPNLSRPRKARIIINESRISMPQDKIRRTLNDTYWRRTLGLDSIAFYRFLYPDGGYYEDRSPAGVAQVAPFVVGHGINAPWVIYIDGQPVYYKNVNTLNPYSFAVKPGIHTIQIRLPFNLITINNVKVDSAQKLTISVNRFQLPPNASSVEMTSRFTQQEVGNLSRYFTQIKWSRSNQHAYIAQGRRYYVRDKTSNYYGGDGLVGPLYPGDISYVEKDDLNQTVSYEPFSSYEFKPGIVKIRDYEISKVLATTHLGYNDLGYSVLADTVINQEGAQAYLEQNQAIALNGFRAFPEFEERGPTGRLTLDYMGEGIGPFLATATFIINLDRPDEYYVLPGIARAHRLNEGKYQGIVLLRDQTYLRADSLVVVQDGTGYYDLSTCDVHPSDSLSRHILKLVEDWSNNKDYILQQRKRELQTLRNVYYQVRTTTNSYDHSVSGRVVDGEDGNGIPGVSVVLKGTENGTITDSEGNYILDCPADGQLIFSFIGFLTTQYAVGGKSNIDVVMRADVQQLNEVIVVGYSGISKRSALSGTVTRVLSNGRVAGLAAQPGAADSIVLRIRGMGSINGSNEPLVILDGVIVRLSDVDYNQVSAFEVLKNAEAISLYGSRAGNGVILLSTRPGATKAYLKEVSMNAMTLQAIAEVPGNTLRKDFSDHAFWQPALRTDNEGKASFHVKFPDDITGWNAYVLAMGSGRMTGQTSSAIQSYKPIVAQVMLPRFLIESDKATALGKITSYKQDTIRLQQSIIINDNEAKIMDIQMTDSQIDSISLVPDGLDSVSVEYGITFRKYRDAERRKIPVFKKGVRQVDGQFIALLSDTTFDVTIPAGSAPVKIFAQADLLDALLDEVTYLKKYPYECNEQLASKLKALLVSKKIAEHRKQYFSESDRIREIIKKLISNQLDEGGWSWWKSGDAEVWITLHIAEALTQAHLEGFAVSWDQDRLINYLEEELSSEDISSRLNILYFLAKQGQTLVVQPLIDSVKRSSRTTIYEKLLAERLSQAIGNKPNWRWINTFRAQTTKGNYYWGADKLHVLDNSIMNTLLVYKMARLDESADRMAIRKMEGFLLENRREHWRNTYESSCIVENLLPDISDDRSSEAPSLKLSGTMTKTISSFPAELTVGTGSLTIRKTGNSPIYFTSYSEGWSASVNPHDKDFIVRTHWDNPSATWPAGKVITFTVDVEVKHDVEYVMIEVPIPAGCSYESKPQGRANGEVHREYYEQKTSIYCKNLRKGKYTYMIKLLPRYSGEYTVNPALAECMYFPTLYGREQIKEIRIR